MQNENLKKKFGISDDGVIQKENFELFLENVNKNEITKEEALEVFKHISNLTEVQKAYLETVKESISAAKEVQLTAMDKINVPNVDSIIKIIEGMSKDNLSSDSQKAILEALMELSRLMFEYEDKKNESAERMNKDNNNFWGKLMIGAGVIAVGAIGAVASSFINKDSK
jgi:hypothetical protein